MLKKRIFEVKKYKRKPKKKKVAGETKKVHPKAKLATAQTNDSLGALSNGLNELWYIVMHNATTHKSPHKRFIDNLPLSSVKNCFIYFFLLLNLSYT